MKIHTLSLDKQPREIMFMVENLEWWMESEMIIYWPRRATRVRTWLFFFLRQYYKLLPPKNIVFLLFLSGIKWDFIFTNLYKINYHKGYLTWVVKEIDFLDTIYESPRFIWLYLPSRVWPHDLSIITSIISLSPKRMAILLLSHHNKSWGHPRILA